MNADPVVKIPVRKRQQLVVALRNVHEARNQLIELQHNLGDDAGPEKLLSVVRQALAERMAKHSPKSLLAYGMFVMAQAEAGAILEDLGYDEEDADTFEVLQRAALEASLHDIEIRIKSDDETDAKTDNLRKIQGALGTEETDDALIEVALNAHRAEQELAARIRKEEEDV